MGDRIIRPAAVSDAQRILAVHRAAVLQTAGSAYGLDILNAWAASSDPDSVRKMGCIIASQAELVMVAEEDGVVAGFGSIVLALEELRAVYVHPNFSRCGIGGRILGSLQQLASHHQMSILKMDASLNAEAFYLKHGFDSVGRGEHVLQDGTRMACIRMQKTLVPR
jgi:putative acetyltransferase